MKAAALASLLALCSSCATSTPAPVKTHYPSMIPPDIDVDKMVPAPKPIDIKLPEDTAVFDPIPIDGGYLCQVPGAKQCQLLDPGFLIDEKTQLETTLEHVALERCTTEVGVRKNLRIAERHAIENADKAYRDRIDTLEAELREARKPQPAMEYRFFAGVLLGAALTVAVTFAAAEAVR